MKINVCGDNKTKAGNKIQNGAQSAPCSNIKTRASTAKDLNSMRRVSQVHVLNALKENQLKFTLM